jgi:hypothetical protein
MDVSIPQFDFQYSPARVSCGSFPAHRPEIDRNPSLYSCSIAYDLSELLDLGAETRMCRTSEGAVKHVTDIDDPHGKRSSVCMESFDGLHLNLRELQGVQGYDCKIDR